MKANTKDTVLIVDDEPANLSVLFEQLYQANFRVLVAEDGNSALKRVKRLTPDRLCSSFRPKYDFIS